VPSFAVEHTHSPANAKTILGLFDKVLLGGAEARRRTWRSLAFAANEVENSQANDYVGAGWCGVRPCRVKGNQANTSRFALARPPAPVGRL
jgi:hypothetical protein